MTNLAILHDTITNIHPLMSYLCTLIREHDDTILVIISMPVSSDRMHGVDRRGAIACTC